MCKNSIKAVKFRVTLNGRGVVNFDSTDQKYFINSHCDNSQLARESGGKITDNQTFAKKEFYRLYDSHEAYLDAVKEFAEKNGIDINEAKKNLPEFAENLKISYNCLRYAIFGGTHDVDPVIWKFPIAASNFIANPLGFSRGYMCPDKKDSFKKKSSLNVTDAIDDKAVVYMELYTKSGNRNDTSLFYKETAGETNYVFNAYFDVAEAQFLSFDDVFARRAVSNSYIEGENYLEKAFVKNYGRVPYTVGVFSKNNEIFGKSYGEYGAKMDDEFINGLIHKLTEQMLSININRNGGVAYTTKVEYKPIYSAEDMISEDGWKTLGKADNMEKFEIYQFYEESSHQDWEARKAAIEESSNKKEEKKAKKGKKSEEVTSE